MNQFKSFIILFVASILFATSASADLGQNPSADAVRRHNGQTYDQVDQFCLGMKPKDSCSIPGRAFEGGGPGVCEIDLVEDGWLAGSNSFKTPRVLKMQCKQKFTVSLDNTVPYFERQYCMELRSSIMIGDMYRSKIPWYCESSEPFSDQFCKSATAGDLCAKDVGLHKEEYQGVCTSTPMPEGKNYGFYSKTRRELENESQTLLLCKRTDVVHQFSPVSFIQKIKQFDIKNIEISNPIPMLAPNDGGFHSAFLSTAQDFALMITLLIEISLLIILYKRLPVVKVGLAGLVASLITHPFAWWASNHISPQDSLIWIWLIELAVVIAECFILFVLLRTSLRQAFSVSTKVNMASFILGSFLMMFLLE